MIASFAANVLGLAIPISMIQIYDRVIPRQGYETLTVLALLVIGAILAEAALRFARGHLIALSGERFEREAYHRALSTLLHEDRARAERIGDGKLFGQVAGIDRLRNFHVGEASSALLDLPFAILFLLAMALIAPEIGITVFLMLAICFIAVRRARRRVVAYREQRRENEERRHAFLSETLSGIDMVRSLRVDDFMIRRYERLLKGSAPLSTDLVREVQIAQGISTTAGMAAPLLTATVGALMVMQGEMTIGALAAVILLTGRIVQPVLRVEAFLAGAEDAERAAADLGALHTRPVTHGGDRRLDRVTRLSMEGVGADFAAGRQQRLAGLSLDLAPGDCLALTASNPAVASFVMRLMVGEIQARSGTISLNNTAPEAFRLTDRRARIRLLTPGTDMLEGTVLDNLTAFQPERYQQRAMALAEALGLDRFLTRTAEGLSMTVGHGSQTALPKSIRDTIGLVQGLLTDPDVILFDNASSGLDRDTDARLLTWLKTNRSGKILVVASHRPSYLRLATRTIDLDRYLVAARGDGAAS